MYAKKCKGAPAVCSTNMEFCLYGKQQFCLPLRKRGINWWAIV